MKQRLKGYLYYLPSVLIFLMIFGFSSQNGRASGHLSTLIYQWITHYLSLPVSESLATYIMRKGAHMSEFALYVLSLNYGLRKNHQSQPLKKAMIVCLMCALFDEYHQTFVAGRAGMLADVLIDCTGGLIMCLLLMMRDRKRRTI